MAQKVKADKRHWRKIDGVLLLNKATGISSNGALQSARRLFLSAKAGHSGTLDPLASGLLPLCFGEATKFSTDLLNADKAYEADVRFGITTTTGDAEGKVVHRCPVDFNQAELEAALCSFRGEIEQIPPMYSALKYGGQPLYRLARQGIDVERAVRRVTIHELDLLTFSDGSCRLRIVCSKGTYIRTLAEDIGKMMKCGAHLAALRRTRTGSFGIDQAFTLSVLEAMSDEERLASLFPIDALLQGLLRIDLAEHDIARFIHGNPVRPARDSLPPGSYRVYGKGYFLGVAKIIHPGELRPSRLVVFPASG